VARPVTALFYAINGTGLGHLSRLLAIAREARALVEALGLRPELSFLTTSEAPHAGRDFPVFKLPSKTVVARQGASAPRYVAQAKLMVSNVVAGLRPDLLVLDTAPEGAFQELVFLRDYARATAFVDRRKGASKAAAPTHQAHLRLYDRVLVPDEPEAAARYPIPAGLRERRRFVGRVSGLRPEDALPRDLVRAELGVAPGDRLVYVSAGGGGDPEAAAALGALIDALADQAGTVLLVGYGPLYEGPRVYRPNVIPLVAPNARRFFGGVDLAFSAAGYNSYQELLGAGVPTAFFAQAKGMDRQDLRVAEGVARGWHLDLPDLDPAVVRARAAELSDPARRDAIRAALADRAPATGALRAAVELLALHAGLPGSPVDRSALHLVAALRGAAYAAPSEDAGPVEVEPPAFEEAAAQALAWLRAARGDGDLEELGFAARQAWTERRAWPAAERELAWGRRLAGWLGALDWRPADARRFVAACAGAPRGALGECLDTLLGARPPAEAGAALERAREGGRRGAALLEALEELVAEEVAAPGSADAAPAGGGSVVAEVSR